MTFNHINRRVHLYLGLILLAWFAVYGISSYYINHPGFVQKMRQEGKPLWETTVDRGLDLEVSEETQPRVLAHRVLDDLGIEADIYHARFLGQQQDQNYRLFINVVSILKPVRIDYYINQDRVKAEEAKFYWSQFWIRLHMLGGYQHDSLLADVWAVLVDIFCVGMLVWVAGGIIIWWQMKQVRMWGLVSLGAGLIVFIGFILGL
ncbi:hypothetical protein ACFL5K_04370 [Gemmatimonadota bacterium]